MKNKRIFKALFLFMSILCCSLFAYNIKAEAAYNPDEATAVYDVSLAGDGSAFVEFYKISDAPVAYEMYVHGSGEMDDYLEGMPWTIDGVDNYEHIYNVTKVTIANDVTDIGGGVLAILNVDEIIIPEGVVTISPAAFAYTEVDTIVIPSSVTTIEGAAFMYSGLTSIHIPETVTTIGEGLFTRSRNLVSVTGMLGITEIPESMFEYTGLTSINIPSNITKIGESAFEGCRDLETITGMEAVTEIGRFAFSETSLTELNLPATLTSWDIEAMDGCDTIVRYTVATGNTTYKDVDGVLYSADGTVLYAYPASKPDLVYTTIDTTRIISTNAFELPEYVNTIEFTSGITNFNEHIINAKRDDIKVIIHSLDAEINQFAFQAVTLVAHYHSNVYDYAKNNNLDFEGLCTLITDEDEDNQYIKTEGEGCGEIILTVSDPIDPTYTTQIVTPNIENPYNLTITVEYKDAEGNTVAEPINVGDYTAVITFETVSVNKEYSITKADPYLITIPVSADWEFSGSDTFLVTEGMTNHGHFEYRLDDGEWSTWVPTAVAAGTYEVWYRVIGDSNHNDIEPVKVTAQIKKAKITATAPVAMENLVYTGIEQFLVEPGTTNVGYMEYKVNDGEWSNGIPFEIEAGTYRIWYRVEFAGFESYGPEYIDVTIAKQVPVLTAPVGKDLTYNTESQELIEAASTTGGEILYKLNDGEWGEEIPSALEAGTYTVWYKVDGGINFEDISEASLEVVIAKATLNVTAPVAKTLTYNTETQELIEAGSTDVGHVEYSLDNETWDQELPTAINAGTYRVWYKVEVDSNYEVVGPEYIDVVITKASINYTAPVANEVIYNGNEQVLITAGTTEQGEMKYKLADGEWITTLPVATNLGEYVVWYKIIGNDNYADVEAQSIIAIIDKATPQVVPPAPKTLTYNGEEQELVVAGSSTLGTIMYSIDGGNYYASIPVAKNAGEYTVWYQVMATENYNGVGPIGITVTIAKVGIVITADDKVMGEREDVPTLTYKVEGLLGNDTLVTAPSMSVASIEQASQNEGVYDIIIKDADAGVNYTITYVNAKLTVNDKISVGEILIIVGSVTGGLVVVGGVTGFILFKKKRILINRA